MGQYTKSHSNYTLKSRHQLTSEGTVYERDMSTIGGKETSAPGQIPIYRSGNFVITVNGDEQKTHKVQVNGGWEDNNGSENWTINTISENSLETTYTPTEVKIKRDFHNLRDYAYYGSCSELIRGSINSISKTYPGELYLHSENVKTYTVTHTDESFGEITETFNSEAEYLRAYPNGVPSSYTVNSVSSDVGIPVYYTKNGNVYQLTEDDKNLYALDNPFELNLIDKSIEPSKGENQFKYLRFENTIDVYSFITSGGAENSVMLSVTSQIGENVSYCPGDKIADIQIIPYTKQYRFSVQEEGQTQTVNSEGGQVDMHVTESEITTEEGTPLTVYAYAVNDGKVVYMVDFNDSTTRGYFGCHIRPNEIYYYDYLASLPEFERLLINPDTEPQRTIFLNLLGENDFGYYTYNKAFTYPTTYGGYNLSISGPARDSYIEALSDIATFYDERFSDNIWRSMTHEGIKNLDWSREKGENDEYYEPYGRIEKTIRVTGRFFDDIKAYTESLKTTNRITYDNVSNLPEYFFTDKLGENGWDAIQVMPYAVSGVSDGTAIIASQAWKDDYVITPYQSEESLEGFYGCFDGGYSYRTKTDNDGDTILDDNDNVIRLTKQLVMDTQYTMPDVHNEFVRRLIINSKDILRHKGTLAGVDMLLGMFGMINKKNVDANDWFDYEVSEYTVKTKDVIKDVYDTSVGAFRYEYINRWKNIPYDVTEYANGTPIPYYGLPVTFDEFDNFRYLYPNFDSNATYDGNPYYQMKGGWLKKTPITFDVNDNIVVTSGRDVYDETAKEIRKVADIRELVEIPYYDLKDGDIVMVNDPTGHFAIVDGVVYDLYTEEYEGTEYTYFAVTVNGNSVVVGNTYFENVITVSNPFYEGSRNKCILEDNVMSGREIRIYLLESTEGTSISYIYAYTNVKSISSFVEYDGTQRMQSDLGYTKYFKITDAYSAGELSVNGWRQLLADEDDYLVVNTMRNENRGNNPHTGNGDYDNGAGYLRVYNKLFKYVIDNDLFRDRVYTIDFPIVAGVPDSIDKFGFEISGIGVDDDCDNDYAVNLDDKILIACDTISGDGETISPSDDKILKAASSTTSTIFNGLATHRSNLIINTKRIDITFNILKSDTGTTLSDAELTQIKYIDSVVLPYLMQMIPSSAICCVKYHTVKKNNDNGN